MSLYQRGQTLTTFTKHQTHHPAHHSLLVVTTHERSPSHQIKSPANHTTPTHNQPTEIWGSVHQFIIMLIYENRPSKTVVTTSPPDESMKSPSPLIPSIPSPSQRIASLIELSKRPINPAKRKTSSYPEFLRLSSFRSWQEL